MGEGIIPLTGTSNDQHMLEDLGVHMVDLLPEDAATIGDHFRVLVVEVFPPPPVPLPSSL